MPPEKIAASALTLDLSPRIVTTTTVTGSPAAAAETIVATLPAITANVAVISGVFILAVVAYTVGTSGTNVTLRVRQTNVAGTLISSTGGMTRAAASLQGDSVYGFDTAPTIPGQVYVVTMQVTAGAAASTVSAVTVLGLVI